MSDLSGPPGSENVSESSVSPGDVASAARSCQVIILILAALAAIACVVAGVALAR